MNDSKPLFLTVDFINDLVHPDGKMAGCAPMVMACGVIARSNEALHWARAQGFHIGHVKVALVAGTSTTLGSWSMFGKADQIGALQLGGWGTAFHQELDVHPDELVIVKPRVSAFYGTPLESLLRTKNIRQLVLAGVSTCHAIDLTAREAHDRDLRVTVLSDCCAARSLDQHRATLSGALSQVAQVRTLDEVRACMKD
ncbi:cysteine hydrolase family protein [Pseudoduganella sp. R-34]|uniref:cysteine hydrolase family protein n=1 Tax=Pseudoduganella sp. R-34 TaxID=3404062 RepID=UPI003CEF509B